MNYLICLFEKMSNTDFKKDSGILKDLLPWSYLPKECYLTRKTKN